MATSEGWLRRAVEELDKHVFNGDLDLLNHKFQIYYGKVRGKIGSDVVQPSDSESVTLADFFPTTIGIDYLEQEPERIMTILAHECIRSFMNVTKGKAYKKKCEAYGFEAPFKEAHASPYLADKIRDALKSTEQACGPFPGKAVKFPTKEQKEKKPTKAVFFCPECGLEYTVPLKKLKDTQGTPTCICGARCGRDYEDTDKEKDTQS